MNKVKVVHFHNGTGGGVLSVIRNLLHFSNNPQIENHVIYTINKDLNPIYNPAPLNGAVTQQIFYYSPKWNFYFTCKQLAKLLPDEKAIIVAHDWLELGMVSNLGLQNPVVQVLHGDFDYYYHLAQLHANNIDAFICISPVIRHRLINYLPQFASQIFYFKFPVPGIKTDRRPVSAFSAIYFVRDLTEERKQFKKIPLINASLVEKSIHINWMIAGGGCTEDEFNKLWGENDLQGIDFYGSLSNEEIIELLLRADIMLLPSLNEGFPVAVVEAMKCGVVPLITDWGGATAELVIQNETGFLFGKDDLKEYTERIEQLVREPAILNRVSKRAIELSNELFDPLQNTISYENEFLNVSVSKKAKIKMRIYGSRSDQSWLPNYITRVIRSFGKLYE